MFIVVLAIALLTSIGLWAARSASMTTTGAGNARRAQQTLYVAEAGLQSTALMLSLAGTAADKWQSATDADKTVKCHANASLPASSFCAVLSAGEVGGVLTTDELFEVDATTAGNSSLSPFRTVDSGFVNGTFSVELTDPGPPPAPLMIGHAVDQLSNLTNYAMVTATSYGRVFPGVTPVCNQALSAATVEQRVRALTVIGPI